MHLIKKQEYTRDWLLERVSQLMVYQWYAPGVDVGRKMKSPIRRDHHEGSWSMKWVDGILIWKDWAEETTGDCIKLVSLMYNIGYKEAIQKIAQDMGILNGTSDYQKRIQEEKIPSNTPGSLIQVTVRKGYTKADIEYWGQFLITPEQLKEERIHSVTELYINRRKIPLGDKEKVYAYQYPDNKFKIYLPERSKNDKWFSNIPTKLVEGLDKLNGHQKVVIVKSKKDRKCLESLLPEEIGIIQTQNESVAAYTEELLKILEGRRVWISYDSDGPGKAASKRVNERYPWMRHINVPDQWNPIKDWADMAKAGMKDKIVEHFRCKGIIK